MIYLEIGAKIVPSTSPNLNQTDMLNSSTIKKLAHEAGFDACGITVPAPRPEAEEKFERWVASGKHGEMKYLENFKTRAAKFWADFPEAKSIVVLGVNYYSKETAHANGIVNGDVARYAWGRDYHHVIRDKVEAFGRQIEQMSGCQIRFENAVDTKPILERSAAQQAGLGFIGKQTQLLSLQFGPWLFLSELVTSLELEPDRPFDGSCGTCRLCIDECPTDAIEESGGIDARKCIAYLTIEHKTLIPEPLRSSIGNRVFGCEDCLTICPYTAKQKESRWTELKAPAGVGPQLDLAEFIRIKSQGEYERKLKGTALLRANRKQMLRNACVALGNSGDPKALSILQEALTDSSELVREHARWAIRQLEQKQSVES